MFVVLATLLFIQWLVTDRQTDRQIPGPTHIEVLLLHNLSVLFKIDSENDSVSQPVDKIRTSSWEILGKL